MAKGNRRFVKQLGICSFCGRAIEYDDGEWQHVDRWNFHHLALPVDEGMLGALEVKAEESSNVKDENQRQSA